MAAVVTAFDGVRLSAAESETDSGTWDQWDSTKSPTQETDIVYQRGASVAAISAKVGTAESGVEFEDDGTVDLSTTPRVVLFKVWITNFAILNTVGPTAAVLYVGSGTTTDRYNYYVLGGPGSVERVYPAAGGWQFIPIDPNVSAYRDATDGTPALGSAAYYAISTTFTSTSKVENVVMDALDYVNSGKGLTLTRGDSTDADGVFQDFVTLDEGTAANRWGIVRTVGGIIYALGTLTIGESGTATEFTDANKVVVWEDSLTDVGFGGLALDLQNAGTVIAITDAVFKSNGRSNLKRWFDSQDEVASATDQITMVAHGYLTGQAVLYSAQGGTAVSGLTDNTQYFIRRISADVVVLHTTRQGAMTAGTPINLTAAGSGQQHSLRRQPDTRATMLVTGTSGVAALTRITFDRFRRLTLTSGASLVGCQFVSCSAITAAQGTIDGCTITTPLLTEGEAFITTPDIDDVFDCDFLSSGEGHAVEITGTGSGGWVGNALSGYWTHGGDPGGGAQFATTSGVNGTTEVITTDATHGLTTGDAVYYNDGGGAVSVGLTDGARYYANVLTTTTLSLHVTRQDATSDTNRVNLTATGSETHALYSTKAAILNNSGGSISLSVSGGDTPFVRNFGNSDTATVAVGSVTIAINIKNQSGANLQNARVFLETAATIAGGEMYQAAVTSLTQAAGTATCTTTSPHGLVTGDKVVVRGAQPDGYNKVATATVSSTTVFTYPVDSGLSSPATGVPVVSFVAIHGLTDAGGDISVLRSWGAEQPLAGWARLKNTSSPFYKDADFAFDVNTTAGNTINAVLQPDE